MRQLLDEEVVLGAQVTEDLFVVAVHQPVVRVDAAVVVSGNRVGALGDGGSRHGNHFGTNYVQSGLVSCYYGRRDIPRGVPGQLSVLISVATSWVGPMIKFRSSNPKRVSTKRLCARCQVSRRKSSGCSTFVS